MADEERPFVISVRHRWTLWILPVIAAIYFLAVIILNVASYRIKGVTDELLVLVGVGIFLLVILIQLPFFLRRGTPKAPKPVKSKAAEPGSPSTNGWDDEILTTSESQQGLQVLEYSAPAKSRNANAVYTKTYVPVSGAHVLRIENLAADQTEI